MNKTSFISGIAIAMISAFFLGCDEYACSLYWALAALASWMDGICKAIKEK
jgi:hypothetical protein